MRKIGIVIFILAMFVALTVVCENKTQEGGSKNLPEQEWEIHDTNRPLPPTVDPGPAGPPIPPPSDAIVLFDGKDLSQWESNKQGPVQWKAEEEYIEVVKKTGGIRTIEKFGDCQLHIEWATPVVLTRKDQGRGNSGVFLMSVYEVQILDGYDNRTYADGMAGAVYGQFPPLINACRPPGEWQTYDIVFHRPHFNDQGKLTRPAMVTVFHNGILVQDHVELMGPTDHKKRPPYKAHPERMPLMLQDHGNPVRFRNIWIRDLKVLD